ncbi:hypothetical protein LIER_15079 [Lithospermum erythrorhizon]|uniref:CCHC-type domain-containing protein n=1 Tax=Lithospermum erythrorhizon TaxID=34254 RepID=A0AAV3Q1G1_LITER
MDLEILKSLMGIKLIEAEAIPVLLEEHDLLDGVLECEASLFVKIHSLKDNFVSLQGFSLAMSKAWDCKFVRISRVRGSILHVSFPSIEDKQRVMDNGPWCFDNNLLVMVQWAHGLDPLSLPFDVSKFWIQVRGLKVGKEVGIGYLAYERLPFCCFHCGLLGHLIKKCPGLPAEADLRKSKRLTLDSGGANHGGRRGDEESLIPNCHPGFENYHNHILNNVTDGDNYGGQKDGLTDIQLLQAPTNLNKDINEVSARDLVSPKFTTNQETNLELAVSEFNKGGGISIRNNQPSGFTEALKLFDFHNCQKSLMPCAEHGEKSELGAVFSGANKSNSKRGGSRK